MEGGGGLSSSNKPYPYLPDSLTRPRLLVSTLVNRSYSTKGMKSSPKVCTMCSKDGKETRSRIIMTSFAIS